MTFDQTLRQRRIHRSKPVLHQSSHKILKLKQFNFLLVQRKNRQLRRLLKNVNKNQTIGIKMFSVLKQRTQFRTQRDLKWLRKYSRTSKLLKLIDPLLHFLTNKENLSIKLSIPINSQVLPQNIARKLQMQVRVLQRLLRVNKGSLILLSD